MRRERLDFPEKFVHAGQKKRFKSDHSNQRALYHSLPSSGSDDDVEEDEERLIDDVEMMLTTNNNAPPI